MRPYLLAILCIGSLTTSLFAKEPQITISGYLVDASSGESLIGANVYVSTAEIGTLSNTYGFYSISVPLADSMGVIFSYLGYTPQVKKIFSKESIKLNISLVPEAISMEELVITAEKKNENVEKNQMSVVDVPVPMIRQLPAILGETDVLKVMQFLPGVQSGAEGTTGFYVRGGNADQNLVLLDEAVVYNPNHLFGLMSSFNSRAINNVTMVKGGFPAQYGGRLSSIMDLSMKEGNNQQIHVDGGIGLVTSKLTVEGPLVKDKSSFIISTRRTYVDLLLKAARLSSKTNYAFYDVNAKVNWKLSDNDRVFASFFSGNDQATYTDASSLNYDFVVGNKTSTLRWNHLFGEQLFANTSLIYTNYLLNLSTIQGSFFSEFYSEINDINGKIDFEYFPNPRHTIKWGLNLTHHVFTPTGTSSKVPADSIATRVNTGTIQKKTAVEGGIYVNDEIDLSDRIGLNLGVRVPYFDAGNTSYSSIEPRISAKYTLTANSSIKTAYTRMNQFVHLVPSSTASVPTDIWLPTSDIVKPQRSQQIALGYFHNFKNNTYETSVEAYYKTMKNQVAFREGTQLNEQTDIDQELVFGKGESYGTEFFLRRASGRLKGWISYTLSRTNQQFPELNFGKTFPFKYDKRHDFSIVAIYDLNEHWTLSSDFVASTGNAMTLPVGRVNVFEGGDLYNGVFDIYTTRNNYRLKSYQRLDLTLSYKHKTSIFNKQYDSEFVLSTYNSYNRHNPYYVYVDVEKDTNRPYAKQVSLLPIIPSISYNFKF